MNDIKNATITSATITSADHGVLSAWVYLDYGDSGHQGFGGYALYLPKDFTHHVIGVAYAGHFIWRVMEVAGVEHWSDLSGRTVRVKSDHSGVSAIGHITKDDWFCPGDDFKEVTR